MVKKVLVVDDDLDAHEIIHDMLSITLEGVKVDQAMSGERFIKKLENIEAPYDMILFNIRMRYENGIDILASAKDRYPGMTDRIVLMADLPGTGEAASMQDPVCIPKPFSLDYFGEVVKKVCCG
jgi:DNA-binding NtrC family response regulator